MNLGIELEPGRRVRGGNYLDSQAHLKVYAHRQIDAVSCHLRFCCISAVSSLQGCSAGKIG
jgi:hypothetical protein